MRKATYDPEANAIYIYLMDNYSGPRETKEMPDDEDVICDITPSREIIGMEFLNVKLEILSKSVKKRKEVAG